MTRRPRATPCDTLWIYPKVDPAWNEKIVREFRIHPVTAQVLAARGFTALEEIHTYLYAKLPHLNDPYLFQDMDKAVKRILKALHNKEHILIYGDNDVDGITAATLLTEFFLSLNAHVSYYVPNRNSLNESLLLNAVDYAKSHQCNLIITVDCGITAGAEIEQAVKENVDVIITDHHEPTASLPHCVATLNPKLVNSTYPNRDITGVGVAFKLAHALTNQLSTQSEINTDQIDLKKYLDLVALGTIADMGALTGENRILVRYGLEQMKRSKRVGLAKLFSICEVIPQEITPMDIASKVAPRLNSLGRIADPRKGVELLLLKNPIAAEALAKELDLTNIERQKIERKDSEDIEKYIEDHQELLDERAIVISSETLHPGIIPIITARIAKLYNRPTITIAIDNGVGKGSIRTIPEFPLLPVLKELSQYLINFGGHDFAAGLTIKQENIEAFRKDFLRIANDKLKARDIVTKLHLASKIDFGELTFDFMESLSLLEPFGNENHPPVFYCEATQAWPPKIVGKTHLKLYLEQKDRVLEGIAFNMGDLRPKLCKKNISLQIAFTPQINNFLNKSSIQLHVRDIKVIEK